MQQPVQTASDRSLGLHLVPRWCMFPAALSPFHRFPAPLDVINLKLGVCIVSPRVLPLTLGAEPMSHEEVPHTDQGWKGSWEWSSPVTILFSLH